MLGDWRALRHRIHQERSAEQSAGRRRRDPGRARLCPRLGSPRPRRGRAARAVGGDRRHPPGRPRDDRRGRARRASPSSALPRFRARCLPTASSPTRAPLEAVPANHAIVGGRPLRGDPAALPELEQPAGSCDFTNTLTSNCGCATATNLGLMVASPADLVSGRTLAPADGQPAVAAVQPLYDRQGQAAADAHRLALRRVDRRRRRRRYRRRRSAAGGGAGAGAQ